MLPFLKKDQEGSVSTLASKNVTPEPEYDMLESAAMDLIIAIQTKDVAATCSALRAAFDIMEAQPHNEGPHVA